MDAFILFLSMMVVLPFAIIITAINMNVTETRRLRKLKQRADEKINRRL